MVIEIAKEVKRQLFNAEYLWNYQPKPKQMNLFDYAKVGIL
jgi:hypothetical protein